MSDWIVFLDKSLELSDYPILLDNGKISAIEARIKADNGKVGGVNLGMCNK